LQFLLVPYSSDNVVQFGKNSDTLPVTSEHDVAIKSAVAADDTRAEGLNCNFGIKLRNFQLLARHAAGQNYSCALGPNQLIHVGLEVFTAVTVKNALFWYVAPCGSYNFLKNMSASYS
jgi:hypothetical protein